jgi:polysaccharide pyruvyl transferase WcaK-like protein
MKRLRLFHFDIKTYGNYGDTLLFEAVRQTFHGFRGGECYEVYDSRPLRDPVGPALVNYINDNFDAVVIGGGGLFLRDTNANRRSGWQWNISLDQLRRLKTPLVIYSVGNNRFIDQADFAPPFSEHVNLTMEKSVFFGLRNTGSMETIKPYIAESNRDRVEFQPCTTTISSYLFPDLTKAEVDPARRLGLQMIVGKRQAAAGFQAKTIYRDVIDVARRLQSEGWLIDSVPHARADMHFVEQAAREGLRMPEVKLFGDRDGLYKGVEYFADLPYFLGTRGHAQMVPFGMGSIPVSLLVHHKTGYFARDIGHPEWAVDPRQDGFADRLYAVLREVEERRTELRAELAEVRERFYRVTLDNLATIYARLTGETVEPFHTPYTPFERRLAERAYAESLSRSLADEKVRELTDELEAARTANEVPKVAEWLLARAQGAADRGDLTTARALLRGLDAASPDFFNGKHRRPRWDEGAYRFLPAPVLQELRSRAARRSGRPPTTPES